MAKQAGKLVREALEHIGAIGIGDHIESEVYAIGLARLDDMFESWAVDDLMVPWLEEITHTVPVNTAELTWGAGGDIDRARPKNIATAWMFQGTHSKLLFQQSHAELEDRRQENLGYSGWINSFALIHGAEFATIRFDIATSDNYSFRALYRPNLEDMEAFRAGDGVNATINLPDGYGNLSRLGLAVMVYPSLRDGRVPVHLMREYTHEKSRIRSRNLTRHKPVRISDHPSVYRRRI